MEVPAVISAGRPAAGAGHLETKASTDVYGFGLAEAETEVYVDDISCPTADMLRWEIVHDVEGMPVTVANGGCEDSGTVRQLGRGEYRLVVSAAGDVRGTYGLRIVASHGGSPEILHVPVATAYHAKAIPIELTTVCEHPEVCSARLHYRTSRYEGADGNVLVSGNWTERDMDLASTATVDSQMLHRWTAEVPGTAVTTTGVDYHLTAADGDDRNELPVGTATPLGFGGEQVYF